MKTDYEAYLDPEHAIKDSPKDALTLALSSLVHPQQQGQSEPSPRHLHANAIVGGKLYVLGGVSSQGSIKETVNIFLARKFTCWIHRSSDGAHWKSRTYVKTGMGWPVPPSRTRYTSSEAVVTTVSTMTCSATAHLSTRGITLNKLLVHPLPGN